MKVLLIGGTGILSHGVAKEAENKGIDVYCLNRGNNTYFETLGTHIKCDVRDVESVKRKTEYIEFDVVVDFLSLKVSELQETYNIFKNKCKQYIFISTATVYEPGKGYAYTEMDTVGNSLWDYGKDKTECENWIKNNVEKDRFYTIVRPYVTYGESRIPYLFSVRYEVVNRILNNKPVIICEGGKAKCTLTNVKDFSVGVVGLFLNQLARNETFHITTDEVLSWRESLEIIAKCLHKKLRIVDLPIEFLACEMPHQRGQLYGDKTNNMTFDNTKIKKAVPEFSAKITFEEGIKESLKYYDQKHHLKKMDYVWEAQMDRIISDAISKKIISKNNLWISGCKLTLKQKIKAKKTDIEIYNNIRYRKR